ncbi:hypothetical protein Tco_1012740, partial [Tanacetum coccineum]
GGSDKPLRPADMLLCSWDGGLDMCVDLTGSSPLTQTGMADFVPSRVVIDDAQRELEENAVTLLKRIQKFSMAQYIGARVAIHIFNMISFAIAKGQLELGVTGTIVLMLCRMWDVYAATGRYLSTDFVVCDSKGNTMHAIARNSIAHNVIKLKEGGIYSVNFFAVQPNKDEFQVLKNATFMFELDGSTTIRKVFVKPDGFIRFPFEMVDFEHLETTNNKYLIDAAGYVTNVGRTVQQKTCSKTLDFHLANSRYLSLSTLTIYMF